MKELSIEDKAKRYDEIIDLVNAKWHYKNQPCIIDISDIFPELKESEDEGIRKEILEFFCQFENGKLRGVDISSWIAWLEKQGEKKQESNYPKFDFDDILAIQCCIETVKKVQEDKELYDKLLSLHSRLHDAYWLEKQGNKPQGKSALEAIKKENVDNANKAEPKDYNGIDPHYFKPTDKFEPKFHIGDWIVNISKEMFLIKGINNGYYTLEDVNGNVYTPCLQPIEDDNHLFTIQDAKDGDVLACKEEILLFKSYSVQNRISLYCWYNGQTNNFHDKEVVDTLLTTRNKVCPATKEQCDLLFSKIKEAGYEWNAENKQLKKIEQKSVEWSEEDKNMLEDTIYMVTMQRDENRSDNEYQRAEKCIDWLKSLKDRVLHQNIAYYNPYKEVVESIAEMCKHYDKANHSGLRDFYDNVKVKCKDAKEYDSLFPKSTWKPSDEQMVALEHFVRSVDESGYASPYDNNTKLLYSLLGQLKKLKEKKL